MTQAQEAGRGRRVRFGVRLRALFGAALVSTVMVGAAPTGIQIASAATDCVDWTGSDTMTADVANNAFKSQSWPGGSVTLGTGTCTIKVTRPSGAIDLVGALGDAWAVAPVGAGVASVSITSIDQPNCTSPLAIASVTAGRPSCSSAVASSNGSTDTMHFSVVAKPILTVTKNGTGSGTVTGTGSINCGATCAVQIANGTAVTYQAVPANGSVFSGWSASPSKAGCNGNSCSFNMSGIVTITATFDIKPTVNLTVNKGGSGSGTVTSSRSGTSNEINCGSTCVFGFDPGATVTLTATPANGSLFDGWFGAGCDNVGNAPCDVSMSGNKTVTATFVLAGYKADGLIGIGTGASVGNGVYNLTGAGQAKSARVSKGKSITYKWTVQNDGSASDTFTLKGAANTSKGFRVAYLAGSTNVTADIVAGTYSQPVDAGSSAVITVKVSVGKTAVTGSNRKLTLTATSQNDGAKADAVVAKTIAK